ncbi:MAG: hypothetical protein K6T61_01305 [Bryobacteraceae bacterium]|nr:hypothetical protein [Bryobacteraceae bacterium]
MRLRWTGLLITAALLASCGYVGDPQPPALKIPARVTDLAATQVEDRIRIRFTVPELTLDGVMLRRGKVDLRAGPYAASPFDAEAWAAQAKALDAGEFKTGPYELDVPAAGWAGQEVLFRVRLLNERLRAGEWSDFVTLHVVAPLERPFGVKAEAVPEGVRVSWEGPRKPEGLMFRVLRRAGQQPEASPAATVNGLEWNDTNTRYGETYSYAVVAALEAGNARAQSAASESVTIVPVDRFAPTVPKGLTALAAPASIELSWDPNSEPDLAGYFVYRAAGEGEFARLVGPLPAPHYSDKEVQTGVRYRYAVSAVDQAGNESARSRSAEASLP